MTSIHPPLYPPALRTGDQVIVVTPSSTIADQRPQAEAAATELGKRLGVQLGFAEHAFATDHYSAGTPQQRAADLMAAFTDPDVHAIVLSMGGATAIDVLDLLDYDLIRANPKIVAGISDCTTVLQTITTHTGLVTFHGLELLDFARHPMPYTTGSARATWCDAWHGAWEPNPHWRDLEGDTTRYSGWRTIRPGTTDGVLVGGNSEAITQLVGGPHQPRFDNAVLVLETYRLQKRHLHALLVSLRQRDVLSAVNALILGYCLGSDEPGQGNDRDLADIVTEITTGLDLPVIQVGEVGHQVENLILPLGAHVGLDAGRRTVTLTEAAVVPHPTARS